MLSSLATRECGCNLCASSASGVTTSMIGTPAALQGTITIIAGGLLAIGTKNCFCIGLRY